MDLLGERLRKARQKRGLSRQALDDLSGVGWQTIGRIEKKRGYIPGADVVYKLALGLKVSTDYLYGLKSEEEEFPGDSSSVA
jgi:transcriptional regulator with XRE-family HTH domain